MRTFQLFLLGLFCVLCVPQLSAQEPSGGIITDLILFDDALNQKVRFHPWSSTSSGSDTNIKRNGTASHRFAFGNHSGFHAFWHGIANDPSWSGPDTSVFWAQSSSRLQVWVRSSTAEPDNCTFEFFDNFDSRLGRVHSAPIAQADTWFLIDVPIPANLRNIPLKGIEIYAGGRSKNLWIDDFKVTNVRLYAGSGVRVVDMNFIGATQLGFFPSAKKQFSTPAEFTSFVVRRVSDNATVFTGGAPVRTVTDGQGVLNGAPVWVGDFSNLQTPGRYKIVAGNKESRPFDIRSNIYDEVTRSALRFFYYQRAFTAITQQHAEGPWFRPTDADKAPTGIVKGWHDAGDLTVYNATMTQSIFWLLETWSDFAPNEDNLNIPESGNGVPDLLDETRWGIEWLLSQQEAAGGFWCNTTAANGTNSYPYGQTFPHTVAPYIKGVPPTTQATAKAVAVLGYAAGVYRPFDLVFANRCLEAATRGWNWMVANPNLTNDGSPWGTGNMLNPYAQGGDQSLLKTNRMWAAAGMLYATGEQQYENAFQQFYEPIGWISSYSKSEAFAASLYLRVPSGANQSTKNSIRQRIFEMANGVRNDAQGHPFQFATHYYWGCNSNAMHRSGQFSWRAYTLDTTRSADRDQGLANIEYLFGRNYLNQCYISGVTGVTDQRMKGFHHWMKALNATPWHFPGALAGGPNQSPDPNDISYPNAQPYPVFGYWGDPSNPRTGSVPIEGRFTDNDSWSTNEVCINWNAALVYNLYAARRVARGSSPTVSPGDRGVPSEYVLEQNFPNPFNPSTEIRFSVPEASSVRLTVYNILGQEIKVLVNDVIGQGNHTVVWDGSDNDGKQVSSGIYFYRMQGENFAAVKKMIFAK